MNTTSNRRSFLTTLSVIAAPVVCGVNRFTAAWAQDLKPGSLPALDESNPVATALGYTRPSFCKRLSANVVAVVHQNIKGEGGRGRRRLLGDDCLTRMDEGSRRV